MGLTNTQWLRHRFNSCLVGTPVADNPFYVDEKTKEQRLAPLTLSLTVYAKDRSMAGEPIIIDSAQCFSIDGWEQNQDYPNDPSRRKPKLSNGDFFTHCVGGESRSDLGYRLMTQ